MNVLGVSDTLETPAVNRKIFHSCDVVMSIISCQSRSRRPRHERSNSPCAVSDLGRARLQSYGVETVASMYVLTDFELDHKTGVPSLEAFRVWRLRRGLECAAHQRHLTVDQVAKLIGHITWSCLLRRPAFVSHQCLVSFCAHFRTSKLADLARSRPGIPLDCVSTAASHLQPYQSLVSMVLCH